MPAVYRAPAIAPLRNGTYPEQAGVNDSPDNSPGLPTDVTFRNGGSACFYILTTPQNTNGLSVYTQIRETDAAYLPANSARSYKGPIAVTCDVDNNDPAYGPLNIVGIGMFSEVRVGTHSQSYGTVQGVGSCVDIRNQPLNSTNEYTNWFGWMNGGTVAAPLQQGGHWWYTDYGLQGPINQPRIMVGISMVTNNFSSQSPTNGASAGMSLQSIWDCGPANNYKRGTPSYPFDIGYHVSGATVGGTGDGYTNAVQIGGQVSNWAGAAAYNGDQGQVGRGVVVKAKNSGVSVARLGAFVSEGTGEGGGFVAGLDTSDANRASLYRATNASAWAMRGSLAVTGPIGTNGASPPAKAANPGNATGTDATMINAIATILRNLGFCS